MRRTRVLAALVVALGVASGIGVVALVRTGDGQRDRCAALRGGPADGTPASTFPPNWWLTPDRTQQAIQAPLTREETEEALRIVSEDQGFKALREIAGERELMVEGMGLLTDSCSTVRIGAAIRYTIAKPIDVEGLVVPRMNFDATDDASLKRGYGLGKTRISLRGLSRFAVQVDLNEKRVGGFYAVEFKELKP